MSISRVIAALLAAVSLASAPTAGAAQTPAVTCEACIVVDDTGARLFARRPRRELPNASTTKMVTALVVRDRAALDEEVSVSATAASVGGGGLDLSPGGGFTVEELLLALLLTSSNEAAVALAEHVSGSEAAFVRVMNRTVRRLGATDTTFVTSHGLDRPGHVSSARDLARIADELLADPVLARMVARAEAVVQGPEGAVPLENRNLLLESYRGAIGVKTGFTALAGNVLVAAARHSGRTLIAVAMDSEDATADAAALLDHGFARLRASVIVPAAARLGALVFDQAGSTGILAARSVRGIVPPDRVDVTFVPRPGIALPVDAGDIVGTVEIRTRNGRLLERVDAIAERTVEAEEPSLAQRFFAGLLREAAAVLGGD